MKKIIVAMLAVASATTCFANRIGVLKTNSASCSETVTIRLDTEDSDGRTKVYGPDSYAPGIVRDGKSGSGVTFTYCVLNVGSMPAASFDYAVLKLSEFCPMGGYAYARRHDTEDDGTNNHYSGDIYPNEVGSNAILEYCFAGKSSNTPKYPFNKNYGVFANPSPAISNVIQYHVYLDDEDDQYVHVVDRNCKDVMDPVLRDFRPVCTNITKKANGNAWYWYNRSWENIYHRDPVYLSDDIKNSIKKIMYGDENTTYYFVRWNGTTLKKSVAASESVVASAAEIPAPLATNIAANIKSVTRENIGVELQTAGDVEISVVGFNGRTFASFTAKNLQPGFNSINWNSTSVPNGHYIVSVKQNGLTRGINVKLK